MKLSDLSKNIRFYKSIFIFVLLVMSFMCVGKTFAALLENDVEVQANSALTYYLNVSYDGVDRNGLASDANTVASINSGVMFVEDKIPDGLEFTGFVTTSDGTIGAVERGTGNSCLGKVIDDTNEAVYNTGVWNAGNTEYTYHGLHYTTSDRTVRFKVKNLKAGCDLTVGIITMTPTIDDPNTVPVETRRDFYNFASIREKELIALSNTVHVFMGKEDLTTYSVGYEYTGTVPSNAPLLPNTLEYVEGAKVSVANNITLDGYTFSGWTTTDAVVSNGTFTMPASNVILSGSFTAIPVANKNTVTYSIDTNSETPTGYVPPKQKTYFPDEVVELDSLKPGDIVGGFEFTGWTTSDVSVSQDGDFLMPNTGVTLVGGFTAVTYNVSYQFYDTVLPPNAENYLPTTQSYAPGATVTLATIATEPTGYKFLGWYKEDNFTMPNEDVVIYGEWKQVAGYFEPTITKTITNATGGRMFGIGEKVEIDITVTNTAAYAIHDVMVTEEDNNAKIIAGTGYTILSDRVANITSIAAGASVTVNAEYIVSGTDSGTVTNTAEIVGALADNDYELKDQDYIATATFNIKPKVTICKTVAGITTDNTFQFRIGVYDSNDDPTGDYYWIAVKDGECMSASLDSGYYHVKEIVPQEFTISSVTGDVNADDTLFQITTNDIEINYNNAFVKKGFLHSSGRVVNKISGGA